MRINLNFLKFHYFYSDKKLHNLSVKNLRPYFEGIINENDYSLVKILEIVDKCNGINDFNNRLLKFHVLDNDHKYILLNRIIKKSHPNLYYQMEQYFSDDNYFKDLDFYQCKISKKERLIFTIHLSLDKKQTFIPLIFDLNHLIYCSSDKQYHNLNLNDLFKWDLRSHQDKIKKFLNKNIKNN